MSEKQVDHPIASEFYTLSPNGIEVSVAYDLGGIEEKVTFMVHNCDSKREAKQRVVEFVAVLLRLYGEPANERSFSPRPKSVRFSTGGRHRRGGWCAGQTTMFAARTSSPRAPCWECSSAPTVRPVTGSGCGRRGGTQRTSTAAM